VVAQRQTDRVPSRVRLGRRRRARQERWSVRRRESEKGTAQDLTEATQRTAYHLKDAVREISGDPFFGNSERESTLELNFAGRRQSEPTPRDFVTTHSKRSFSRRGFCFVCPWES
jgi:hypothetical protein